MNNILQWHIREDLPVSSEIKGITANHWLQQGLVRNGITTANEAFAFLSHQEYQPHSALELPDMDKTVHRLQHAIQEHERIGVWGDFDVDGQTATTILVQGLRELGADVVYHIPVRETESHGMKTPFLKEFLKNNIRLLLTCDTGVSETDAIQFANTQQIDVLITDHHTLPEILPPAYSVVNPQRLPDNHVLRNLAGVGTAYKLIESLFLDAGRPGEISKFLDLVALGTIADVALLQGENRYLVQHGLEILRTSQRLGLQEIYRDHQILPNQITETQIAFLLAPILNSLGRLSDANPIVDFLTTKDVQFARTFASQLALLNQKRKLITEQIGDAAQFLLEKDHQSLEKPAIILHHADWQAGVLGIVANRLVETYQKPVILLTGHPDTGMHGSARSIEGLNITTAIRENQQFLLGFGGHSMAAGMSLHAENFPAFKNGLYNSVRRQLGNEIEQKRFQIDGFLDFESINLEFIQEIERLGPFGAGNPAFLFATRNLSIERAITMGAKGQHLRLRAKDSKENQKEFIWWRGDRQELPEGSVDIAYRAHCSTYRGVPNVQLELVSFRESEKDQLYIRKKRELQILDFRQRPVALKEWIQQNPAALIWQEGLFTLKQPYFHRHTLKPSTDFVVLTIPPNISELRKALQTVNPDQLILADEFPQANTVNEFIKTLSGLLKFAIEQKHGLLEETALAAVLGHRRQTIRAGLEYLSSSGIISMIEHPDTQIFIRTGGVKDTDNKEISEQHLRFLLHETYAFRKWYKKASIEQIRLELFDD
ncbi:MAG: single-stranded-DNA-specific exonuclease RecJ [Chloroflexi bacterium HGW-Chloroflexi-10]|nr:MAG: single-stranded-DNA-specific exonuclease RecJ [Chloroflexi bacterium HGW-Chloroflexi-10]